MKPTISKKLKFTVVLAVLLGAYLWTFYAVHTSVTFRRPAGNLAYWYYSDNPAVEKIMFFGFWPLRQLAYHVSGFKARHNDERIYQPYNGL